MVDDAALRVERAEKMCRRRRTYAWLPHASWTAERLTKQGRGIFVPYLCGVCGYYHVCRDVDFEQTWEGPERD